MSTIAIIPARAGSKRLPGKNTMDLGGRPLLAYSTMVARKMETVDAICCTSDDPAILETAWKWGADILVRRDEDLAGDTASILETLQHALQKAEEDRGIIWDWVVLLQPNVPLREASYCDRVIRRAWEKGAGSMMTVDFRAYKLGSITGNGWYIPDYPVGARKQDMDIRARENGVLYLLQASQLKQGILFAESILPVPCGWDSSLSNIDNMEDFYVAKALFSQFLFGQPWSDMFDALQYELIMPRVVEPAAIIG